MSPVHGQRRFRVNPIELVIFSVVTLIFANSIYQLFYNWDEIRANTATPLEAQAGQNETRSIASSNPLFGTIETHCASIESGVKTKKTSTAEIPTEKTDAVKIRLAGPLCSPGANKEGSQPTLVKTEIINRTTNNTATVITNTTEGRFSTDFIPLSAGPNQIQLRWIYQGGREVSQNLVIQKN